MDSYITEDETGQKIRVTIHTKCPNCHRLDTECYDEHLEELYCTHCGLVMEAPFCPDLIFPGRRISVFREYI